MKKCLECQVPVERKVMETDNVDDKVKLHLPPPPGHSLQYKFYKWRIFKYFGAIFYQLGVSFACRDRNSQSKGKVCSFCNTIHI